MTQTNQPDLGEFEGRPVLSHAVELPSLAGGLREAAEVSGSRIIQRDDEGYLLIKFKGNKTRFDPVKNTEGWQRVDIPTVEGLTFVEGEVFERHIADHQAAVEAKRLADQKAKEEAEGVQRVPGTEPWPDAIVQPGDDLPDGDPEADDDDGSA